jgi:hypothetical protein
MSVQACALCGATRSLRFDREASLWVCYQGCQSANSFGPKSGESYPRKRRETLFCAWWTDPASGRRLGRATRGELREAHRLWRVHRATRESGGG